MLTNMKNNRVIEFIVRQFGKTVYSRPNRFGRRRKKNHNIYGNSYC